MNGLIPSSLAEDLNGKDPVIRLAPTGISAFGIRGWTVNYGLGIRPKEKKFQPLTILVVHEFKHVAVMENWES